MRMRFSQIIISLSITALMLIVLEIFSTALIPAFGLRDFMLPFNVLFILFLAFRVNTPILPILILVLQVFHSIFSVEGWAHGTFIGVIISIGITFLKDILAFKSAISTIIITFIAMVLWYVMTSLLFYISIGELQIMLTRVVDSLPECFVISLISPFFFSLLDKIWRVDSQLLEA